MSDGASTLTAVPPLVRHFEKGLARVQPHVPWYEATFAYLLVVPGVLGMFVSIPLTLNYIECTDPGQCSPADALWPSSGSYTGILWTAGVLLSFAVLAAALVQLTVRKLHFALVWLLALSCNGFSLLAYLVISGGIGTPWGRLVPFDG